MRSSSYKNKKLYRTNITEPPQSLSSSRGSLASSFLLSDSAHPLQDQIGKIIPRDAKFAGFNLLLLAPAAATSLLKLDASFVSNGGAGGSLTSRPLSFEERISGCFSNGVDGKGGSDWPKVKYATQAFASLLQNLPKDINDIQLTEHLFDILRYALALY